VSGGNANLSLGSLCASYVSSLRISTPYAPSVQLAACRWLAKYSLSQHPKRPARLEKYWSMLRY
jgi:hypothetical protein